MMKNFPMLIIALGLYVACLGNQKDDIRLYVLGAAIMILPFIADIICRKRDKKYRLEEKKNMINRENTWNVFKNTNLKEKKNGN